MAVSVRYHVRSSSMPSSRSHPVNEKVEEKLGQLRQWESLPSTSSSNSLSNGLSGLSELYQSIDDLLQLPQAHKALSAYSSNKKCIEEVLDGSLKLLDSCGTARDIMMQIADAVKDLQLAMRRRVVSSKTEMLEKGIASYLANAKKMKRKASKCIKTLMIKTHKSDSTSHEVESQSELAEVMTVLKKAMSISINILEQLLCFLSNPKAVPTLKKRSSLVLIKWIGGSGRVSCEEKTEKVNEIDTVQEELNTFLDAIRGLEVGLDVLQRRLIQTRVSLLNILSH